VEDARDRRLAEMHQAADLLLGLLGSSQRKDLFSHCAMRLGHKRDQVLVQEQGANETNGGTPNGGRCGCIDTGGWASAVFGEHAV